MKNFYIAGILFSSLLLSPLFAAAHVQVTASGSGSISNTTSAEADSGGQATPGGQGVTTGQASASAHATTVVGGGESGTVEVQVETSVNGQIQKESIKKEIPNLIASSTTLEVQVFFKDLWVGFVEVLQNVFWFF